MTSQQQPGQIASAFGQWNHSVVYSMSRVRGCCRWLVGYSVVYAIKGANDAIPGLYRAAGVWGWRRAARGPPYALAVLFALLVLCRRFSVGERVRHRYLTKQFTRRSARDDWPPHSALRTLGRYRPRPLQFIRFYFVALSLWRLCAVSPSLMFIETLHLHIRQGRELCSDYVSDNIVASSGENAHVYICIMFHK